jgi:hypothetical protein
VIFVFLRCLPNFRLIFFAVVVHSTVLVGAISLISITNLEIRKPILTRRKLIFNFAVLLYQQKQLRILRYILSALLARKSAVWVLVGRNDFLASSQMLSKQSESLINHKCPVSKLSVLLPYQNQFRIRRQTLFCNFNF